MKPITTNQQSDICSDIPHYRNLFNGQEADNEVYGEGCSQNYGFRMYDTRLGRFWGVDPLTKDYPMLTPFQFASNTPIWGVDIDGLEVRVYVETPQYLRGNVGHVFLSVGSGDNVIAYSYGRYGELGKNKGSLNSLNRRGEGILYRYTSDDAVNYIRKTLLNNNAYAFEINGVNENDVQGWFDFLYYNRGKQSSSDKLKDVTNAKAIDLYDLISNNCTTKTIDALRVGGSKESFKITETITVPTTGVGKAVTFENDVNTPDEMFGYMFMKSSTGKTIKNVTNELKKEYVQSSE
jgi:RHS repeat-associated protein